jgi:hypothetical protein
MMVKDKNLAKECTIDDVDFEDITNNDISFIIDMPKNKEEINNRFNLSNSECSIDDIDFSNPNDTLDIIIPIPKTQKEFQDRFII